MAIEKVREYFAQFGMEDKILEFDVSSATVELAAKALGTEEARIAKTMSFKKDDGCILIVTAGDVKIDNAKYYCKQTQRQVQTQIRAESQDAHSRRSFGVCRPCNRRRLRICRKRRRKGRVY